MLPLLCLCDVLHCELFLHFHYYFLPQSPLPLSLLSCPLHFLPLLPLPLIQLLQSALTSINLDISSPSQRHSYYLYSQLPSSLSYSYLLLQILTRLIHLYLCYLFVILRFHCYSYVQLCNL